MRSYQQKKWQLLAAGVLMSICTSCFTAQPAWAAEYNKGLTGKAEKDAPMLNADGNTVVLDKGTKTVTYDFKGTDNTFTVVNKDAVATKNGYNYVYNNIGSDGSKGTLYLRQTNTHSNDFSDVAGSMLIPHMLLLASAQAAAM